MSEYSRRRIHSAPTDGANDARMEGQMGVRGRAVISPDYKKGGCMTGGSLPRRYARALIELAKEEGQMDSIAGRLGALVQVLEKMPGVLVSLASDSFDVKDRLAAMAAIADQCGFQPLLKNFLLVLVKKHRINLLAEIFREYQALSDEILGILRLTVTHSQAPAPEILARIEKILGEKLKKKVISHGEARPEILGGLVLKIDNIIYDGSIRKELERMKEQMLKGS